jgi:anti-sigma-K factor RskA
MTPSAGTSPHDLDELAAEYVLGTLDREERTVVAARRLSEPNLDAAILAWETRLSPLADTVQHAEPPAALKSLILARVQQSTAAPVETTSRSLESGIVVSLTRRVAMWRTAALGASAIAASLAGVVAYRPLFAPPSSGNSYVAVLQKNAQSPAFLVTVDVEKRTFIVRTVAAAAQSGKSYELWLISEKLSGPKSLGVVGDAAFTGRATLTGYSPADIEAATYAVTLETQGGSPSGTPSGPVIYAGRLVQTRP